MLPGRPPGAPLPGISPGREATLQAKFCLVPWAKSAMMRPFRHPSQLRLALLGTKVGECMAPRPKLQIGVSLCGIPCLLPAR